MKPSPASPQRHPIAQSTIEYVVITTLVMLGIMVMGPYVVRSINAFFRDIDGDIEDSFTEEFQQREPTGYDLPGCECGPLEDVACGASPCGNERQMLKRRECTPPACELYLLLPGNVEIEMERCEYDLDCCTDWQETGNCGEEAMMSLGGHIPDPGCIPGDMEYVRYCGGPPDLGTPEWACQSDCQGPNEALDCPAPPHPMCGGECTGTPDAFATLCVDSLGVADDVGVFVDTPITYVLGVSDGCTDAVKCEYQCNPTFFVGNNPDTGEIGCICPDHAQPIGGICYCMPGYVANLGSFISPPEKPAACGVDECAEWGCGPGNCSQDFRVIWP